MFGKKTKVRDNTACINTTCKLRKKCARYCYYDFYGAHRKQSGLSFNPRVVVRDGVWLHECEFFIGFDAYGIPLWN